MKKYKINTIANINKFSFAQMTSNSDGKTSGSGTMGVLICTVGTICFLLGAIDAAFITKTTDILVQSIIFVGMGAALLGYRKSRPPVLVEESEQKENVLDDKPLNS